MQKTITKLLITLTVLLVSQLATYAQSIILGRPTNNSITASILFDYNADFYLRYGTHSGNYSDSLVIISNVANMPDEVDMQNLFPDTKYFYQLVYRQTGTTNFVSTPEYSFHTQRAPGSSFTFTIEADEHLYDKKGVDNMYRITLDNQAKDNPDFMITLGDIFGNDHTPSTTTLADMDTLHRAYRPFLDSICHSVPFYVCLGNHEGEKDYYLDSMPPNNIAVYGTLTRKKYYPNPFPNNFYTGDTVSEGYGMGLPENYYAWTWGNALFVVLDVYRYDCDSTPKPHNWDWTLGIDEYNWLANTLQNSTATYKFVFAHHIRGEDRGGITNARLYEWGGYDGANGTTYSFSTQRPGWAKPIHQLFVDNGVNIFFQGHDHLFAHEVLDSVTYQEVPMAADSTYQIGMLANASAYTADTLDGTGHIRVNVSPTCVQVDYIRAYLPADTVSGLHHNGEVAFSYSIGSCTTSMKEITYLNDLVNIYPNPAQDKLAVRFNDDTEHYQINLINTLGQTILQSRSNIIDVSNIQNGIYYMNIKTAKFEVNKKVIINR